MSAVKARSGWALFLNQHLVEKILVSGKIINRKVICTVVWGALWNVEEYTSDGNYGWLLYC